MGAAKDEKSAWRPATRLVHEGTLRSQFGETSEAIFLNSGYVYESAEQAEARFKGDEDGYVYSRYANPTVSMLEGRMCALEGAPAARGTSSGMAAVSSSLLCHLKTGDHVVSARALFGSCRYIVEDLLPRYGIQTTLVDGRDLDAWQKAVRPNTRVFFFETPTNPVLELVDIARRVDDREKFRRARRGRQCVRYTAAAAADAARRRHCGLFGDQAYRRPGALPRWRRARPEGVHRGEAAQFSEAHRPLAKPVQCLGAAERPRDAHGSRRSPYARRRRQSPISLPSRRKSRASTIPAEPTIRRLR